MILATKYEIGQKVWVLRPEHDRKTCMYCNISSVVGTKYIPLKLTIQSIESYSEGKGIEIMYGFRSFPRQEEENVFKTKKSIPGWALKSTISD